LPGLQIIFPPQSHAVVSPNSDSLNPGFDHPRDDLAVKHTNAAIHLVTSGVVPGRTNLVQALTNLLTWQTISTNWIPNNSPSNSFFATDNIVTNFPRRFYRGLEAPLTGAD
jgi:hypothetical protein